MKVSDGPVGPVQAQAARSSKLRHPSPLLVAATAGSVALVLVLAYTVPLPWSPLVHWECREGGEAANLTGLFIPAVLVNSPYGGGGWGNGTFPATFPGVWSGPVPPSVKAVSLGTGALNGSALGTFFEVNASAFPETNTTVWGPGANSRCHAAYAMDVLNPPSNAEVGVGVLGANSTSDAGEPSHGSIIDQPGAALASFDNAFVTANRPAISTCGGAAVSIPSVESDYLEVSVNFTTTGKTIEVAYTISVQESYHYWFPPNYGTWEIDDLSAPGGPGGGWAFAYAPCA
jgi:hypothetical protein